MVDKCNCYRFSPRDSLSGAVAQIADYLSKHPGWNETELRAFVDGLISSAGVETFNGRSGNVTLNKDDVNNLLIANCYFAEADETIESIDVLALYKLGIRIVFTQYSSEVDGYTLAYGIEYYPATDTAKAYLFSSGSGGVGAVVSVNGKTGTVILKAGDILMNNGDSVEDAVSNVKAIANAAYSPNNPPNYPVTSVNSKTGSVMLKVVDVSNGNSTDENAYMFIDESDDYPDVIAPDSSKLGGQLPSYYAPTEEVSKLKDEMANYRTAVNLLINSYFTNPVNQRGATSLTGVSSTYFIDRWETGNNTTVRLENKLLYITGSINQRIVFTNVSGKTLTFAVCDANGNVSVCTFSVPVEFEGWKTLGSAETDYGYLNVFTTDVAAEPQKVAFSFASNAEKAFKWAALYEGSYTADTLPPYVSKGYTAELAECQRYYRKFARDGYGTYLTSGLCISETIATFSLHLDKPMRVAPTVTFNGAFAINSNSFIGASLTQSLVCPDYVEINATASNLVKGYSASLQSSGSNSSIELSADL